MRNVLLLLAQILYDPQVKYIHVQRENMKKAVIYTGAVVNIKAEYLTSDILSHFCMDCYAIKTSTNTVKYVSYDIQCIFETYTVSVILFKQGQKVFWSPSASTKPSETRVVH